MTSDNLKMSDEQEAIMKREWVISSLSPTHSALTEEAKRRSSWLRRLLIDEFKLHNRENSLKQQLFPMSSKKTRDQKIGILNEQNHNN